MAVRQENAGPLPSPMRLPAPFRGVAGPPAPPLAFEDFDDVDDFVDAAEEQLRPDMDLGLAFEECEVAIRKFFNNDISGAMAIMGPWCQTSMYHSLGSAIFEFIPAILTFDSVQMNRALTAIKACVQLCNEKRKDFSILETLGTIIRKPNYGAYTDEEAHAELIYAEALLLQAAMTVMDGEDLTDFIRGTLKVKSCHDSYKDCAKILEKKVWDSEQSKIQFQSGVRLGIATFNVMISMLPSKVISVLEIVGFSANKALGLKELQAASGAPGIRSVLCDVTLLAYHLVVCPFTGTTGSDADYAICEQTLANKLQIFPNSVWFLLFKGRLALVRGEFNPAISTYNRVILSQQAWKQFRHLCYWEIMWINAMKMEWREAANYAGKLLTESSWSRTIYSYMKASLLMQMEHLSPAEKAHVSELFSKSATYKQRISGKSLPMEKFIIRRTARYAAQGGFLVIPAIELLCLWNMFGILANNERNSQAILKLIEGARDAVEERRTDGDVYAADNRVLLRYLHGCILYAMGLPHLALQKLETVFMLKNDIKEDTFLLPYSLVEMALCHHQLGNRERAIQLLQEAKKKYSGYSLESRLNFRVHSKLQAFKAERQ